MGSEHEYVDCVCCGLDANVPGGDVAYDDGGNVLAGLCETCDSEQCLDCAGGTGTDWEDFEAEMRETDGYGFGW